MAAVSHSKALTQGDFTGTVTVYNSQGSTVTAAATDLARPADWNSAHNFYQTISGNTLGTSTASGTNLVLGATGGVTLSHSTAAGGATAWVSVPAIPKAYWACPPWQGNSNALISNVTATAITQRPLFFPFNVGGNLTAGELHWLMSRSTSGSNAFTVNVGVYSYSNDTRIDLIGSVQNVYSNTDTGSISAMRMFEASMGTNMSTLSPGQYVLGLAFSAAATASMNYSLVGAATNNVANQTIVVYGSNQFHTYTSHAPMPFWGKYTTTSGVMPASVPLNAVSGQVVSNLPIYFTLANHN